MSEIFSLNLDHSKAALTDEEIAAANSKVKQLPVPFFAQYVPDFASMERVGEKYRERKNIIIEGNGGSISTIRGFFSSFEADIDKNVFLLDTSDPDYIAGLKKKCPVDDTLLIVISKSGESIDALSGYLALQEYETVFITAPKGALYEIGQVKAIPIVNHPEVSGRFSGITECALFPAFVLGIDTPEIVRGARDMYDRCAPSSPFESNPALRFAIGLDKLEKMDYDELFISIYSKKVTGFFELIVQLFHESVCKNGKGQTIYGGEAPENQHHTLQRFNSGRKNSVGIFMTVDEFENGSDIDVPEDIKNIVCRNITVGDFGKLKLDDIIRTEFEGTWKDTLEENIPSVLLSLGKVSPYSVGMLIAFFQYAAFYSSVLRDVDPFNQPGVEKSKEYIFKLIEEKNN